jgi:hypothetical protein
MRDLIKSPFLGEVDRRVPLIARSLTRSSSRGSSVGRWLRSTSATSWRSSEKRSSLCGVFMWPYTHEGPASRPKPLQGQRAAAALIPVATRVDGRRRQLCCEPSPRRGRVRSDAGLCRGDRAAQPGLCL